ncbi:YraN family protein [soil metagenome]
MDQRATLGRTGEDLAASQLKSLGFDVLARNVRGSYGELDIVARRGSLVVFCEVKTRRSDRFGMPAEAVGYAKQQRIRRLAGEWLNAHRPRASEIRFDVVSVVGDGDGAEVTHIPGAF